MVINDSQSKESISIGACGSGIGNGVCFTAYDEYGNDTVSVFTNDKEKIRELRDELDRILENPESFIDPFIAK